MCRCINAAAVVLAVSAASLEAQTVNPRFDAHTHLLSPAGARWSIAAGTEGADLVGAARNAAQVLAMLDEAGIWGAVIVSEAYALSSPYDDSAAGRSRVMAENDWTLRQALLNKDRLIPFCSVHALMPLAPTEIRRCAALGAAGIKLSLSGDSFDLRNPAHAERLGMLLSTAANAHIAVMIHMRTARPDYGAADVRIMAGLASATPDAVIQIAHMAGWGGYDAATDAALSEWAAVLREKSLPNLYFDLAWTIHCSPDADPAAAEAGQLMARRIREIGAHRFLFATDWPLGSGTEYAGWLAEALDSPEMVEHIFHMAPPYGRPR